ncbi:MAG: PhoU domain-containing protein [Candidatus Omnitrophota bacterium]|jgi:phosphate:Na+ symporter
MDDFICIKEKIDQMAELALSMLANTFDGFMKHDLDMLSNVLKEEDKLNEMERSLSFSLVEAAKDKPKSVDNRYITLLVEIIADLEEVGDYVKDMIERIEIKIKEKLFFSDDALSEYRHLYNVVHTALSDVVKSLKMNDKNFAKRILGDEEHVGKLLVKYRDAHTKRLISGICDPRAGNMFLNLLDFTAQIFRHTRSIADNILDLK